MTTKRLTTKLNLAEEIAGSHKEAALGMKISQDALRRYQLGEKPKQKRIKDSINDYFVEIGIV